MDSLEGGYKGKTKNYHSPQTSTSQITSIDFVKPFALNQTNQSKSNNHKKQNTRNNLKQLPSLFMPLRSCMSNY